MAAIDVEAQYAIGIGKTMGSAMDPFNVIFYFQYAFIGVELSVALLATVYFSNSVLRKFAALVTAHTEIPEVMALLWAVIFTCTVLNTFLTLKVFLVVTAYLREFLMHSLCAITLVTFTVLTLGTCCISKKSLHLYLRIPVPHCNRLIFNVLTVGLLRRRAESVIKFHALFQVCFFIPLSSVHVIISVLAIIADPMQNGVEIFSLLGLSFTFISLFATLYSWDPLLSANRTNIRQKLTKGLYISVKWLYVMMFFTMVSSFGMAIVGLLCLDIRSSFYRHYRVSHYLQYYLFPVVLGLLSWAVRHFVFHFQKYFENMISDSFMPEVTHAVS